MCWLTTIRKVRNRLIDGSRMVVRVRVIHPVIMGLTGSCPTQHHCRGSDCMLLAREKIKVQNSKYCFY